MRTRLLRHPRHRQLAGMAGMFNSPGLVDLGDAGTFTRASTATAPDHNGKYRPVKANEPVLWGSMPRVDFIRQSSVTLSPPSSQQYFWNYRIDGNYLYSASHTAGCDIFDITDPAAPTFVANVRAKTPAGATSGMPMTDVIVIEVSGTKYLFMCGRAINFTTPAPGYLVVYNVSNPASPTWVATFEDTGGDNPWYQGMDTDGTYLFVAAQYVGIYVFDISNPAALTIHGRENTGQWETSRLVYHNGYLYCANHGYGVRILDVADPANPGAVTNRAIAAYTATDGSISDTMRIRNVEADGNYLYAVPNVATADGNSPLRGLLTLDISDPTTVPTNGSTWVHVPIAAEDVDTWNNQGDKPIMGGTKLGHFFYAANGQRGAAVFDVRDPSVPVYLGLTGTQMADSINLYQSFTFSSGGADYCYYGSGAEVPADQTHILYADKIAYGYRRHANSKGILLEGAATNVLTNPNAPASQITGSLATGDWTLSCEGSGSITPVAITAVGTGFAAATDGAPTTFNLSGAGTVGLAVAGSLDWIQLEAGAFNTSFVDGARVLHSYTLPAPVWFRPNNMCGYLEFTPLSAASVSGLGEQALFDLLVGTDQFKCYLSNSGGGKAWVRKVTGAGAFSTGQNFTPVAGTKVRIAWKLEKGVGMKIWVNGALGGPGVTDTSDITVTGSIRVGARNNGTFPCYGAIGNVQIWHKPLSDTFLSGYGA